MQTKKDNKQQRSLKERRTKYKIEERIEVSGANPRNPRRQDIITPAYGGIEGMSRTAVAIQSAAKRGCFYDDASEKRPSLTLSLRKAWRILDNDPNRNHRIQRLCCIAA